MPCTDCTQTTLFTRVMPVCCDVAVLGYFQNKNSNASQLPAISAKKGGDISGTEKFLCRGDTSVRIYDLNCWLKRKRNRKMPEVGPVYGR